MNPWILLVANTLPKENVSLNTQYVFLPRPNFEILNQVISGAENFFL